MPKPLGAPMTGHWVATRYAANSATVLRQLIRSDSFPTALGTTPARCERVREYFNRLESILKESPHISVTLSDLAYILDLERTYCCRVCQEITGKSFSRWIRGMRIARARLLLRVARYTVTDVAHAVGYDDITTFERNFRKEVGMNPTTYRRLIRMSAQRALQIPKSKDLRHEAGTG